MEILIALDRLNGRLGEHKALADVLERRIALETDEKAQADLYYRLAVIQIEKFGDRSQGLATLRLALERAIDHEAARAALEKLTDHKDLFEEAAEALENVYRTRDDNAALAKLYNKRIDFAAAPADRVRMRLDLARVLEERSKDPKAAQSALELAFADDPTDHDVLAEIERLAPITSGWTSAAEALEKAIRASEDLTSDAARDLWLRVAGWRKDKTNDAAAAERDFEEALKQDSHNEEILRQIESLQRVPGREKELIATLRRIAALDGMGSISVELRREAKGIAESALKDAALAEAIVRDIIATDEGDAWALAELTQLREAAGDNAEVFKLLVRRAELGGEAGEISKLRHQAATVAREKLKEPGKAIELYEQIFEDEPDRHRGLVGAPRALRGEQEAQGAPGAPLAAQRSRREPGGAIGASPGERAHLHRPPRRHARGDRASSSHPRRRAEPRAGHAAPVAAPRKGRPRRRSRRALGEADRARQGAGRRRRRARLNRALGGGERVAPQRHPQS